MPSRGGGATGTIIRIALRHLRKVRKRSVRTRVVTQRSGSPTTAVRRLPSGRYPANYRYAGKVYDGKNWTPKLQQKYPNGVRFSNDGFPDFSPYAQRTVTLRPTFAGDRSDFALANRRAGLSATPDGFTWHHHQDTRTMQLIPTDLHRGVRHAGGVAIMKGS